LPCPPGWTDDGVFCSWSRYVEARIPPLPVAYLPDPARWIEVLVDLDYTAAGWALVIPEQIQACERVQVADVFDAIHARALIHAHSHHVFAPTFSREDDADHVGFRLYAVLGCLDTRPMLRVRVGVYGYWMDVPAWTIFERVPEVRDAHADA